MILSFKKKKTKYRKVQNGKLKKKSLLIGELYKTNRLIDIEDKSMDPKGKKAEGIN